MRLLRSVLLAFVALALCAGAASAQGAQKTGARLDPSFGRGGVTTVATPAVVGAAGAAVTPKTHLAVAPSGRPYVEQGNVVVGFGANGRPDPKFGKNGRVSIQPGPGKLIEVSGVAVDSRGRVLVAGTYEPFPGFKNPIATGAGEMLYFGNEPATEAFVIRYLPNGEPDPSFGDDGIVISTLGVPRPTSDPGEGKAPTAEYERPVLRVGGIRVDSENRPVLAADYVFAEQTCFYKQEYKHAIVARLTESGAVDTSFGGGGHTIIPGEHTLALTGGPDGEWVALGERERGCYHDFPPFASKLAVLAESGTPSALDPGRPDLDANGALAVDQYGRILFAEAEPWEGAQGQPKITRLLSNGDVDTSFGHDGGIVLDQFGSGWPTAIAVDGKGRIVVGISGDSQGLEVTRLTSAGKVESKFGRHGLLTASNEAPGVAALAIDSKGRILAAGPIESKSLKTSQGIGIARYLPGG